MNKTMITNITKALNIIVKYNIEGINPSTMANYLDYEILDILIDFVNKNSDTFYSITNAIELEDLEIGHFGYFSNNTGDVVINEGLVLGLTKKLVVGVGDKYFHVLVDTVLHEHRHCYQRKHKLPMTKVPYVSYKVDYEAYHNHPMEVDAREKASEYTDAALEYIYGRLYTKYINPIKCELRKKESAE